MCRAAMFIRYNRETPLKVDFGEKNYDALSKYDTTLFISGWEGAVHYDTPSK